MYQVLMFNPHYDDQFFISHFIQGLKTELRSTVEAQVSVSLEPAFMIARVQQEVVNEAKQKNQRNYGRVEHIAAKTDLHYGLQIRRPLGSFGGVKYGGNA
jgi:hypothetical protein